MIKANFITLVRMMTNTYLYVNRIFTNIWNTESFGVGKKRMERC